MFALLLCFSFCILLLILVNHIHHPVRHIPAPNCIVCVFFNVCVLCLHFHCCYIYLLLLEELMLLLYTVYFLLLLTVVVVLCRCWWLIVIVVVIFCYVNTMCLCMCVILNISYLYTNFCGCCIVYVSVTTFLVCTIHWSSLRRAHTTHTSVIHSPIQGGVGWRKNWRKLE